jgi:asparagine synthase (glutamine-hydrolysing)
MVAPGNKVDDFCAVFESLLQDIAKRTNPSTRCLILSGVLDMCAILQAASQIGMTFAAAVTVVTGDDSPDGAFATAAAKQHGLPHFIVKLNAKELVETQLKPCIQKLETFDGMTLCNSLVVAAAFQKVAELGFNDAIVGNGADELFGGYSFTWKMKDSKEWKEKRDSMCANWMFVTGALASMHGLKSHSPYMEPQMVEWSNENTQQNDCIGKRPIQLVYGGKYQDHITGKIIL